MLLKSSGHLIDNFFMPAFSLSKGEIVIIQLPSGPFFQSVSAKMIDIFTGKINSENVTLFSPLHYVSQYKVRSLWYRFLPITVAAYHNKYANKKNAIYKRIYEVGWITPETKVVDLPNGLRRQLSMFTTLSHTSNITLDLIGLGPEEAQQIFRLAKECVTTGGAVVLFDNWDEFKHECTTFILAEFKNSK